MLSVIIPRTSVFGKKVHLYVCPNGRIHDFSETKSCVRIVLKSGSYVLTLAADKPVTSRGSVRTSD